MADELSFVYSFRDVKLSNISPGKTILALAFGFIRFSLRFN